ncbi:MAG: hypothetical protein ABUL60_23875 [Myxococcales bacterium]
MQEVQLGADAQKVPVIFGNPDQFAIEAAVETGPEFAPVQGAQVVGRIAVWLNGARVGRLEEPACWLRPPCSHLEEVMARLECLWDDSFLRLTPEEIFDLLDRVYFGAHRHQVLADLAEKPTEVHDAWRFQFLIHSSEAFDGWKGFLVRPTMTSLMGLILARDSNEVVTSHFPKETYCQAVREFSKWLAAEEHRLFARS